MRQKGKERRERKERRGKRERIIMQRGQKSHAEKNEKEGKAKT